MSRNDLPIPLAIFLTTSFIVCGLVMGSLVIADYNETKEYDKHECSGATKLDVQSGGMYSHGTLITNVLAPDGNGTIGTAELFYPPIRHWLLIKKSQEDVKSWAAGLGSVGTFVCRLNSQQTEGVSALYDEIVGWYFFLIFAVLAAAALICAAVWMCCN